MLLGLDVTYEFWDPWGSQSIKEWKPSQKIITKKKFKMNLDFQQSFSCSFVLAWRIWFRKKVFKKKRKKERKSHFCIYSSLLSKAKIKSAIWYIFTTQFCFCTFQIVCYSSLTQKQYFNIKKNTQLKKQIRFISFWFGPQLGSK